MDKSILNSYRPHKPRRSSTKMPKFLSLEWTFIERLEISTAAGKSSQIVFVFGCGPYLFTRTDEMGPGDDESFGSELAVFEETGAYVRGIVDINNGFVAAWGDSYVAYFSIDQLFTGGSVCQKNILSTGLQIASVNTYKKGYHFIELYCVDGLMHVIILPEQEGGILSIAPRRFYRLPIKLGEKLTAGYTKLPITYIGTSMGRLFGIRDITFQFATVPLINSPVKQIVVSKSPDGAPNGVLILFDCGSIVCWKDKDTWMELKGRYTCVADFSFALPGFENPNESYTIAGDLDGNLTAFRIEPGKIEILRTIKCVVFHAVTAIHPLSLFDVFIGSKMGDYYWFDMTLLYPYKDTGSQPPPTCLIGTKCNYRTTDGWYFLKNDKLCKAFKPITNGKEVTTKKLETYFEKKSLRVKYLCSTGVPDREIAFAYSRHEYFAHITDFSGRRAVSFGQRGESLKINKKPAIIVQVILMHSYILIQYDSARAQVFYVEATNKRFHLLLTFETSDRISAAACIVRTGHPMKKANEFQEPLDFMVTYHNGTTEMTQLDWKSGSILKTKKAFHTCSLDLQGSYIVSGIASRRSIGTSQCMLLSRSGIAYLIASSQIGGEPFPRYKPVVYQDLSRMIGHGHSIVDTSLQTLAIGFKRNTLHICWIFLGLNFPPQYGYLFSVDTASPRLPFTIIENRKKHPRQGRRTGDEIIISYSQKDGIKETHFPFIFAPQDTGHKHSGTIAHCYFRREEDTFYTGDRDGRFSVWSLDPKAVNGMEPVEDFKFNGSITAIFPIVTDLAVATSQGDLYLFHMVKTAELIPRTPYNLGQKITHISSVKILGSKLCCFFVFLGDGSVMYVRLLNNNKYTSTTPEAIMARKAAKLPVATKMALCYLHRDCFYITTLGVDGFLRRTRISEDGNRTAKMSWKISMIDEFYMDDQSMLMVGDPRGWVYFLVTITKSHVLYGLMPGNTCFHLDRLHKHEIVDIVFYPASPNGIYIVSLDISGTVIIRKVMAMEGPGRPTYWICPVPSPRKIEIVGPHDHQKQIIVFGKGIATKSYAFL